MLRSLQWRIAGKKFSSSAVRLSENGVVIKCPPPDYDTGCTFCKADFPPDKQIDFTKPLNGTKTALWKHALVVDEQDPNEWPSKIEMTPGTLTNEISIHKRNNTSPIHPIMVSNINIKQRANPGSEQKNARNAVLLYPNKEVIKFDIKDTAEFLQTFMNPIPGSNNTTDNIDTDKFEVSSFNNSLILICGHAKRDARCGHIAPLLLNEFTKVLSDKKLLYDPIENPDGIMVAIVSHVGGHVYAGNVIYFNEHGKSFWYGRVFPENVQGLIKETVENGNIIKELYRGFL